MLVEFIEAIDGFLGGVVSRADGLVLEPTHVSEFFGVDVIFGRDRLEGELNIRGALLGGFVVNRRSNDGTEISSNRERLRAINFGRGFVEDGRKVGIGHVGFLS